LVVKKVAGGGATTFTRKGPVGVIGLRGVGTQEGQGKKNLSNPGKRRPWKEPTEDRKRVTVWRHWVESKKREEARESGEGGDRRPINDWKGRHRRKRIGSVEYF